MADLDDDAIIVSLPADGDGTTITKVENVKKVDETDPIADLKGQFDTLRNVQQSTTQRLTTTEQELATTKQELAEARKEVSTSQIDTVTSGLAAAEAEASAAERDYIAAAEAGDFAAQARAQRKISGAEARIQRLQEAKADLEDAKPAKVTQRTEPTQQVRQTQQDPVEAVASGMAPRAAAWIRSHPDCITDKSKNAKMMATHYAALADGLAEGGNEYFERLDAMVNEKPARIEPKPEPKPDAGGKRPSSAAAPSGHSGGGMNGGSTEVRLTAREVTAATDGSIVHNTPDPTGKNRWKVGEPIGVQIFAQRKAQMTKEGHYDKSYSEN